MMRLLKALGFYIILQICKVYPFALLFLSQFFSSFGKGVNLAGRIKSVARRRRRRSCVLETRSYGKQVGNSNLCLKQFICPFLGTILAVRLVDIRSLTIKIKFIPIQQLKRIIPKKCCRQSYHMIPIVCQSSSFWTRTSSSLKLDSTIFDMTSSLTRHKLIS